MSSRKRKPKATSIKETWWFNRPVFFGLFFLTFSSLITSCSMMQMLAEVKDEETKIELDTLPTIVGEEIFYLSCRQPDDETFFRCRRLMYDWNNDGR
jgi:hypothetical protein